MGNSGISSRHILAQQGAIAAGLYTSLIILLSMTDCDAQDIREAARRTFRGEPSGILPRVRVARDSLNTGPASAFRVREISTQGSPQR